MKSKTHTRQALFSSVIALILCCTTLLGSTFAWFTDSVESENNLIKSGNLDIEVEYTLDGKNWNDFNGANDLFGKGLWEPGHTEVVALKVMNKGSLALKYAANMNIVEEVVGKNKDGGDIVLSDILTVTTITHQVNEVGDILLNMVFGGSQNTDTSAAKAFKSSNILASDQDLLAGDAHYVIITVDMAETVGNEANHDGVNAPSITFGMNVLATQLTYEHDSFGNQYDADAEYPNLEYEEEIPSEMAVLTIDSYNEFLSFATAVNSNGSFKEVEVANNSDVYVKLTTDIDLADASSFNGIGNGNGNSFNGVFNGYGHTIENWTVSANWNYYMSLFRTTSGADIKNLTIENFNLGSGTGKGTNAGAVIGAVGGGDVLVDNVTVKDCSISTQRTVGAIVGGMTEGKLTISNCTVENVTLNNAGNDVENNRIAGVLLGKGYSDHDYEESGFFESGNTVTNVTWLAGGNLQDTVPMYTYNK